MAQKSCVLLLSRSQAAAAATRGRGGKQGGATALLLAFHCRHWHIGILAYWHSKHCCITCIPFCMLHLLPKSSKVAMRVHLAFGCMRHGVPARLRKYPFNACQTSSASQMKFAHVFDVAAQVTEEDMLAEEQGSCRSLGTSESLDSSARLGIPRKDGPSERALQLEAAEEAPAKTWRWRRPWGKPKAEKEGKPVKQVRVKESCRRMSASLVHDF